MARRKKAEEHENLERWLVSYADFITLLFAFFVVMYSISSVNEGKYRVLSDSLVAAFKQTPRHLQPIQFGDRPSSLRPQSGTPEAATGSMLEMRSTPPGVQTPAMAKIADKLDKALSSFVDEHLIRVRRDALWVEVEISERVLFPSGSARLGARAVPVLRKVAGILEEVPNPVQVEGFTDNVPISTPVFPSNWELSAARAASVVHLFMREGVAPRRMAAVGYGEFRPVADNDTPAGREKNRRVVVVVLADPEARRVLDIQRATPAAAVAEPPAEEGSAT